MQVFFPILQILFREGSREVYGVEYERHGRVERAIATKEVIISAGAITTPKLLMLSGIGPWEHLHQLGVSFSHHFINRDYYIRLFTPLSLV